MATRNLWRRVDDPVLAAHPAPEPPALAPVAPAADVPLIPGENMLSAATIRALWRAQIARNQTNDRYKPQNTCAKLTASERREIKRLYAGGVFSQRVLARMFEVSQTTIHETITRSVA